MQFKPRLLALAVTAGLVAGAPLLPALAQQTQQPRNNCEPGDRVNGTSAADAQKKMAAAGYTQIHGLMKGCDSFWHGIAMQNGQQVRIVLSPSGQIMQEGD